MSNDTSFTRHADWLWAARRVNDPKVLRMLARLVTSRIAEVAGQPFVDTPLVRAGALAHAAGVDAELWIKNDTVNIAGSHKVRHLCGLAIHAMAADPNDVRPLAIASCGNAALAAAVVAKAVKRDLRVFIPTDANEVVVRELRALDAHITVCPRVPGEVGDPCFLRFSEATAAGGAVAFCCQGSVVPDTFDGGRTIAWEIVEQLAAATGESPTHIDDVYVQVGGGALAASVHLGFVDMVERGVLARTPRLHAVQAAGVAPLARAHERVLAHIAAVGVDAALAEATAHPERFMWAWEDEPHSVATGICDDVTYDWLAIERAMLATGGSCVVVDEATLARANDLARAHTAIAVDATGTAGFAGLLAAQPTVAASVAADRPRRVVVLFTGLDREDPRHV